MSSSEGARLGATRVWLRPGPCNPDLSACWHARVQLKRGGLQRGLLPDGAAVCPPALAPRPARLQPAQAAAAPGPRPAPSPPPSPCSSPRCSPTRMCPLRWRAPAASCCRGYRCVPGAAAATAGRLGARAPGNCLQGFRGGLAACTDHCCLLSPTHCRCSSACPSSCSCAGPRTPCPPCAPAAPSSSQSTW